MQTKSQMFYLGRMFTPSTAGMGNTEKRAVVGVVVGVRQAV